VFDEIDKENNAVNSGKKEVSFKSKDTPQESNRPDVTIVDNTSQNKDLKVGKGKGLMNVSKIFLNDQINITKELSNDSSSESEES